MSLRLTAGEDAKTGTADDDTFNALITEGATSNNPQTLNSFDQIDGGEGNDTLNATLNVNTATTPIIENVETLNFRSVDNNAELNLGGVSGAEQVWNARSVAGQTLTLSNAQSTDTTFGVRGTTAQTDITFADAAVAGASDTLSLALDNAGNATTAADINVDDVGNNGNVIENISLNASGTNNADLAGVGTGVTNLTVTGEGSVDLNTMATNLETVAAADHSGGLTLTAAGAALQEVTTGAGDDNITLAGALAQDGFVATGAGNDTVNAVVSDINAGARIELGAGDDVVTNLGTVDKDAVIDGGEGTDTLQLQAVAAANVGAFQNFEVFDVDSLNKTLDMNILNANNDVQEVIGSDALAGGSALTNLGEGVGFRATGDMGSTNALTLSQATAGALDVTLDADQLATAGVVTNDAETQVVATNATSVNVAFDSESINEIDPGNLENTQTINLTVGNNDTAVAAGATSINVVSGGENASNVLVLDDQTSDANGDSILTDLTITGDQDLDASDIDASTGNSGVALESVDASALTGDLTIELADLANGAEIKLGSGADSVIVAADGMAEADLESIVGFEKSASTTDTDVIAEADVLDFANAITVGTGTATANASAAQDGIVEFLGAGPSTLDEAIGFVDGLGLAADEAVAFEYVGDTYVFTELGTAEVGLAGDSVAKLAGVTDVDSLNANAGGDLYIA